MGLNGSFSNATFPPHLAYMSVRSNSVTGSFISFPENLTEFQGSYNATNGSLPEFSQKVYRLGYTDNNISGDLPQIPDSLAFLDLDRNQLSSGLDHISASNLKLFSAVYNKFSSEFPILPLPIIEFYIQYNSIFGQIPDLLSYTNLYLLRASHNRLNGAFPPAIPISLKNFEVANNYLNGTLPLLLPNITPSREGSFYSESGISTIDISMNDMTGVIPILPNNIQAFFARNNSFYGPLPPLDNTNLDYLDVSYNQLTSIQSLTPNLRDIIINNNLISGSIVINKPVNLQISNNSISNVVINDLSRLVSCDLSSNPLLGNATLLNITLCDKNDLFYLNTNPIQSALYTFTQNEPIYSSTEQISHLTFNTLVDSFIESTSLLQTETINLNSHTSLSVKKLTRIVQLPSHSSSIPKTTTLSGTVRNMQKSAIYTTTIAYITINNPLIVFTITIFSVFRAFLNFFVLLGIMYILFKRNKPKKKLNYTPSEIDDTY